MNNRQYYVASLLVFLTGVNLLIFNDLGLLRVGIESYLLPNAKTEIASPLGWLGLIAGLDQVELSMFNIRAINAIFFLLVNLIVFLLGKPILGTQQMALTVLVASGNWVLLMLSKLYTPDIYLSGLTLIGIFLGIRFYKKPNLTWLFLFILVNLELSRVSPYNGLILGLIYPIGMNLLMKLPKKEKLEFYAGGIGSIALGTLMGYLFSEAGTSLSSFLFPVTEFSIFSKPFVSLLSYLPVLGFLLAGLQETYFKVRKGEEFARIMLLLILMGLFSNQVLLLWVLALLIAKQLQNYFVKNYPYEATVKAISLLGLVSTFIGLTVILIISFLEYRGAGFRSLLMTGGGYWILIFIMIIGLYGKTKLRTWAGALFAGPAVFLLFWSQLAPILHANHPERRLIDIVKERDEPIRLDLNNGTYLSAFVQQLRLEDPSLLSKIESDESDAPLVTMDSMVIKSFPVIDTISGRTYDGRELNIFIGNLEEVSTDELETTQD